MHPTITKTQQQGISLISMMVGVILSMITVAASFMLFQQTVLRSNDIQSDMQLEGQLATILLSLQLETQTAGYGMDNATLGNTGSFFVRTSSSLSEVYWKFNDGGFKCRSFIEALNGAGELVMYWREPTTSSNCTEDSDLISMAWSNIEVAAQFPNEVTSILSFDAVMGSCWPFEQGIENSNVVFRVTAKNSLLNSDLTTKKEHNFQYCLTNI